MISREEYIRLSLELNLFFARIAKEHSIFIEGAFTAKDADLAREADMLKNQFEMLLAEAISLSNGVVSRASVESGEFVTPHTLAAEGIPVLYGDPDKLQADPDGVRTRWKQRRHNITDAGRKGVPA